MRGTVVAITKSRSFHVYFPSSLTIFSAPLDYTKNCYAEKDVVGIRRYLKELFKALNVTGSCQQWQFCKQTIIEPDRTAIPVQVLWKGTPPALRDKNR
jgi:hypothetical protein